MKKITILLILLFPVMLCAAENPAVFATAVTPQSVSEGKPLLTVPAAVTAQAEAAVQAGSAAEPAAAPAAVPIPAAPDFYIQSDTSAVKSLRIFWSKSFEGEEYNILRKTGTPQYERLNGAPLKVTQYADADIVSLTAYTYKVERITGAKQEYSQELQVTAPARNPPMVTASFRGYQDIESAMLKWTPAPKTSFDVAGYRILRGKTKNSMESITVTAASAIRYEDTAVEPAVKYYYKIRTIDTEGNESEDSRVEEVVPFPEARTNLILMPTAYRNNIFDNYGFNADMRFSYYIGTILGSNGYIENVAEERDYYFSKIGLWMLTADIKAAAFNDYEPWPSVALGFTYTLLLQDKLGSSGETGGSASLSPKDQITQMYAPYLAVSKKALWDTYFTLGYMLGGVHDRVPTLFMSYLKDDILTTSPDTTGVYVKNSANTYYFGFSRKLFDRVGFRLEYIVPVEANKNALFPNYYLINTHFDRLINFDIGYFHYPGGYSLVGYFSFRFSVYPNPYR